MKNLSVRIIWPLLLGVLVCGPSSALAQSQYYWDATSPIDASPGNGGTGNWDTNAANSVWWTSGSSDSAWANGNIANFAGTAGIVTVDTPVTNDGITFATTGYTINGGSNVTLATATITLPDGGTDTINCPLAGTTTVTINPTTSGPSTLILGGTNTYTGATSISSGATLTIGGASKLGNGTYAGATTINGALIYDSLVAGTNSGTISGSGSITVDGSGALTLSHANTGYTGSTTINAGSTLVLTSISAVGTATTITDNGILDLNTGGTAQYSMAFAGSGVINFPIAYATASENDRFEGAVGLENFAGTVNVYTLTSTGATNGTGTIGSGQLLVTLETLSYPGVWNIGPGTTVAPPNGATCSAAVILNGPGNSQPYGALRLEGGANQTGNVLLNGNGITIGDDTAGTASQISGNMSDGGNNYGWAKAVGNPAIITTIILSGINTYTGPTIFSSIGTLQVGSAETPEVSGPLGKSPASNPGNIVFSGATLQYSSANNYDYSGRFSTNAGQDYNIDVNGQSVTFATPLTSVGGELTLKDTAGGGTLTLSGANTYNGITTINSGTLNISGSIKGSTAINLNGAAILVLSNSTALSSGAVLTLPGSPNGNSVNLNFSGTQTILALYFGSAQQPAGTYSASVNNSSGAFTGAGTLVVAPQIFWDGNGTDASSQSSANGGGNGPWNSSTSDWWVSGSSDTKWTSNSIANFAGTAGMVALNASEIANGITFDTDGYTLNGSSNLTLGGLPTIAFPNGGAAIINCPIAGIGGLMESGSGTLTLTGSNTFTGAVTIASSCTLILSGTNAYANTTTIDSGSALIVTNGGDLDEGSYPGAIVNDGSITYASSASQTLSGLISGPGSLTQDGPGALTLSGLNTMNGPITINSGTLTLSGVGDLNNNPTFNTGSYSGAFNDNGAFIYNSSAQQTISSGINGTGSLALGGTGTLTLSGGNFYGGPTTIGTGATLTLSGSGDLGGGVYAANITNNGTFNYSSSSSQTLEGAISGTGPLKQTSGSLTLSGTNTYTNLTTVSSSGTLDISSTGSILGSLTLSAGTSLEFDNASAMVPTATLTLASGVPVNLNYTGTMYLNALIIAGTTEPPGFYGSSAAEPNGAILNGSGLIDITGAPISISSPTVANNQLTISWNSVTGANYNVYYTTSLTPPVTWTLDNSGPISSQGATTTYTLQESLAGLPQLFVTVQQ